jgi:hypothetical protein
MNVVDKRLVMHQREFVDRRRSWRERFHRVEDSRARNAVDRGMEPIGALRVIGAGDMCGTTFVGH